MSHSDVITSTPANLIESGRVHLGIELGSTRIKAVLIDGAGAPLASGSHAWENQLVDGRWTYATEAIWAGLEDCITGLRNDVSVRLGTELQRLESLGISAMMHGYLALDAAGELLVPFRTWRNTDTAEAADILTRAFEQNIPLRWSIAHLLQAVLDGEEHVSRVARLTTLAGYVHHRLTGRNVLGVGDASGMFPIDPETMDFSDAHLKRAREIEALSQLADLRSLLPEVLDAGSPAGELTAEGALLLDPSGQLAPGAVMAPPEGDAGTGMVATESITPRTGNVSAGTSAFAMVVLDKPLKGARPEIDIVATPVGDPVAMIHTNNCTGDLDQWLRLFADFARITGSPMEDDELYRTLFSQASSGEADAGGIISFNFISGEHQVDVSAGRPLLMRPQGARFSLPNFMRAQLYGAFGALAHGMRILREEEDAPLESIHGHGGIFRTQGVAQQILADALNVPVGVSTSAGEGGAWGMAILASYVAARTKRNCKGAEAAALESYLRERIFDKVDISWLRPNVEGSAGFSSWLQAYRAALPVERLAGEVLN